MTSNHSSFNDWVYSVQCRTEEELSGKIIRSKDPPSFNPISEAHMLKVKTMAKLAGVEDDLPDHESLQKKEINAFR